METCIIGRLLCTNKALRALVWQLCTGQVPVILPDPLNTTSTQQFASWAARQGHVMQSLRIGSFAGSTTKRLQASSLAAGLQAAAASPLGLHLLEYHSTCEDTCSSLMLTQLPAAHLTSLTVHIAAARDTPATAAAVNSLGNLRRLRVAGRAALESNSPVLAVLPALTALISLHIKRLLPPDRFDLLAALPGGLKELCISRAQGPRRGQLSLAGLTALTNLQVEYCRACSALLPFDLLPPNVVTLQLNCCPFVEPLLQLVKLQQLSLTNTPAHELLQLRPLMVEGQLRDLHLQFYSSSQQPLGGQAPVDAPAAAAWAQLPCLHELLLTGCHLELDVVTGLAKLQGLTRLGMVRCNIAATTQQLAAALQQMSSLVELDLVGDCDGSRGSNWGLHTVPRSSGQQQNSKSCAGSLLAALAHLAGGQPGSGSLRSLRLVCPKFYDSISDVLSIVHARQLTRLHLGGFANSSIREPGFQTLVWGMPQLRELGFAVLDARITDASLATVAAVMTQLTHLDLSMQGPFSVEGVRCLTQLKKLRVLALPADGRGPDGRAERFDAAMRQRVGLPPPVGAS